ncbi:MAG: hypothetical protein JJE25_02155 [Bacteroidia bacterium]|nr:hypothetical protein [Bacteroidia bacterium]
MNANENNEHKKTLLNSIEKKDLSGGFAVPENYFEILSNNIEERVRSIPNLVSIPKGNEFEVPQNYFAELEIAIREKVSSETQGSIIPAEQWFRQPKLVLAYASVLIFAIATSTYFLTTSINQKVSDKDISFNDIYSSEYVSEFDESSLVALLDESPSSSQTSTQIEDYMIDNNIDILTLTDQL